MTILIIHQLYKSLSKNTIFLLQLHDSAHRVSTVDLVEKKL